MLEWVSDTLLVVAFVSVTVLLLLYGVLQPWWRSVFGIAMILTLTSLWQIEVRAVVTMFLGEDYAGRDWILLVGRAEIAAGMTIGSIGLGRELLKSWRATRRPESDRWSPRDHFGDSQPVEQPSEP